MPDNAVKDLVRSVEQARPPPPSKPPTRGGTYTLPPLRVSWGGGGVWGLGRLSDEGNPVLAFPGGHAVCAQELAAPPGSLARAPVLHARELLLGTAAATRAHDAAWRGRRLRDPARRDRPR